MEFLLQDVRYAFRTLRRSPGFTAVALLTLAIGIGATTAIFSVVNAVLLRPYPFEAPERVVAVSSTPADDPEQLLNLSYAGYIDVREQSTVLEDVAVWDWQPYNLRGTGEAVFVGGGQVSANFFDVLGVRPILGRTFLPGEDRPGRRRVVILGEGLWRDQFGADPDIIGRNVTVDGVPREVVGVMPSAAAYPYRARMWMPLVRDPDRWQRDVYWLSTVGRLAEGATLEQARAELTTIAARLAAAYPETDGDRSLTAVALRVAEVGETRPLFIMLLGAVGFVLLIACANVANLLLARTVSRTHELAIRTALGADRGRIVRHVLTESLVLALGGCALGFLFGQWGVAGTLGLIPIDLPAWVRFEPDARVAAFTIAVCFLATLLFGLPPAMQAGRSSRGRPLAEAGVRQAGGLRQRAMRSSLVIGEVALSLTLLVGAGMMIRSFLELSSVSPGFETGNRLTAAAALAPASYDEDVDRIRFYRQVLERLEALPGVERAGVVSRFPLRGSSNSRSFTVAGQTAEEQEANPFALTNSVSPDYFRTMGIPLLQGRAFGPADGAGAPPVAIVNDEMARRYWPGESPIGQLVKFGPPEMAAEWMQVVGVVGSIRHYGLENRPDVQLYVPYEQHPTVRMSFIVAATSDPAGLFDDVRSAVAAVDPGQALYDMMRIDDVVAESMWSWRFFTVLFWVFAAIALVLAAVGLFGVIAYMFGQRTREIGIRMALGAERGNVRGLVVRQGLLLVGAGVAIGLAAGLAVSRLMAGFLFGVHTVDPPVLVAVVGILGGVGLLACYLPARRASRVDPVEALRAD